MSPNWVFTVRVSFGNLLCPLCIHSVKISPLLVLPAADRPFLYQPDEDAGESGFREEDSVRLHRLSELRDCAGGLSPRVGEKGGHSLTALGGTCNVGQRV